MALSEILSSAPPQHFDYSSIDDRCDCLLCVDWRAKRAIYLQLQSIVLGHRRSCMCKDCKEMRRVRTSYHAAVNKRDLFSEMSWLAHGKAWGAFVMQWLNGEINRPERGDGWWEGRAPYYSMAYWLNRAHHVHLSVSAGVSGMAA